MKRFWLSECGCTRASRQPQLLVGSWTHSTTTNRARAASNEPEAPSANGPGARTDEASQEPASRATTGTHSGTTPTPGDTPTTQQPQARADTTAPNNNRDTRRLSGPASQGQRGGGGWGPELEVTSPDRGPCSFYVVFCTNGLDCCKSDKADAVEFLKAKKRIEREQTQHSAAKQQANKRTIIDQR